MPSSGNRDYASHAAAGAFQSDASLAVRLASRIRELAPDHAVLVRSIRYPDRRTAAPAW